MSAAHIKSAKNHKTNDTDMKILVTTNYISRKAGGLLDAVKDLFQNQTFQDQAIELYSFWDEYSEADMPQWDKVSPTLFKPHVFLYSRRLRRHVLKSDADILHIEGIWRYPHLLVNPWRRKQSRPVVCSPHGMLDPYIIKEQGKLKRLVSSCLFDSHLRNVSCFHALCEKEYDDIRSYGLKNPVAIIPNGINLPETPQDKDASAEKKDGKKHLLFLGRVHKKKGIDLLIQAIINIKASHPDLLSEWVVDIVGWDHENCMAEMKEMVGKAGLDDLILFHGGLFGEDKTKVLLNSDAFILPSHGEGLPMSVLEAWSYRLPVLMTDHCHLPEGFQADAAIRIEDNVESVEKGITQLMSMSVPERMEMGENGYRLVVDQFTWDKAAAKMIQLYEWLTGKAERPGFVRTD